MSNRWAIVEIQGGVRGLLRIGDLSKTPLQKLSKRKPVRVWYVAQKIGISDLLDRASEIAELSYSARIEDLGGATPEDPFHFVRYSNGKHGLLNISTCRITEHEQNIQKNANRWKAFVDKTRRKKGMIRLPNYKQVVSKIRRYKGKLALVKFGRPSSYSESWITSGVVNRKQARSGLSFVIKDDAIGYYSVNNPIYEMFKWENGSNMQAVVRIMGVVREEEDKMPLLRVVAISDGNAVYFDEPRRCVVYFQNAARAFLEGTERFWNCMKKKNGLKTCRENTYYIDTATSSRFGCSQEFFWGCLNAYSGSRKYKKMLTLARAIEAGKRAIDARGELSRYGAGTLLFGESLKKAKKVNRKAVSIIKKALRKHR